LLPGDPGRCARIAAHFDQPKRVAQHREFTTYTGALSGVPVSVTSTGIGNPSAAIAIEELIALGADTFIRVGTAGGMQPHQRPGELAIISAAIRDEGTTRHYMPVEFPALANMDVLLALRGAAERLDVPYSLGISHSKDSYYGQVQPERMPVANRLQDRWQAWIQAGAVCAEMETATLYVLSAIHRARAGSVTLIAANQARPEWGVAHDYGNLIGVAVEALKLLIQQDERN
jgi:uridine phosphorylase